MRRGRWEPALAGLRALVEDVDDPGMLYAYSVPLLARLLARRGDEAAAPMLAAAWGRALRQRLLIGLAYAGLASVERAWLVGDVDVGAPGRRGARAAHLARRRRAVPGRAAALPGPLRAGGRAVRRLPGAVGGRACAATGRRPRRAGRRRAIPYEQALELAESGEPEPTLEAVRILDGLGAGRGRDRPRPPAGHGHARAARGRRRGRGPTPPGSPAASSRCWSW